MEDALVVAQWMIVFLRKSDVLKIACLAQIVNVLAPILTTKDAMLKQSIYYPIMLFSQLDTLDVAINASRYETQQLGAVPSAHRQPQSDSLPVDLHWQATQPQSDQQL